jgi:hypothetical protein
LFKNKNDDNILNFNYMTPEEKKLFLITRFNTSINREEDHAQKDFYIRKCK